MTAALLISFGLLGQTATVAPGIEEFVVEGVRDENGTAGETLQAEDAINFAGSFGDPLRAIENLPGVGRLGPRAESLVIWGATPGDSAAYVQRVPVPRLFHFGGLRSVVPPLAISSAHLSPGGYRADLGRSVGGVVDVSLRAPRAEPGFFGAVDANLVDASASVAFVSQKGLSLELSGRHSLLDVTYGKIVNEESRAFVPLPVFWDYQARFSLDDGDAAQVFVFGAGDRIVRSGLRNSEIREADFHRIAGHIVIERDDGSTLRVVPWVGMQSDRTELDFAGEVASREQEAVRFGLRVEEITRVSSQVRLRLGLDIDGQSTQLRQSGAVTLPAREGDVSVFGLGPGDRTSFDEWRTLQIAAAGYASVDIGVFEWLHLNLGARAEPTLVDGDRILPTIGSQLDFGYTDLLFAFDPRLQLTVRPWQGAEIGLFGTRHHQAAKPRDLSPVFGNPRLGLQSATHLVARYAQNLGAQTALSLAAFDVRLSGRAVRNRSPTPPRAAALEDVGTGRNIGVQASLRYRAEDVFAAGLAYTLMRAERRDGPEEAARLFDEDQTHHLVVNARVNVGHGFAISARLRYATGFPRTEVTGAFLNSRDGLFEPDFGVQNAIRLPTFFDASLRGSYEFNTGPIRVLAYLDVVNATNRTNAEELIYSSDYTSRGVIAGFPILPNIGLKVQQ